MRSADEIAELYRTRRSSQGVEIERMREARDIIQGDIVIPLYQADASERPMVANLAQQGLQQMARRIASVEPTHHWPTIRPGSDASEERARNRGRVMGGWHHDARLMRRLRRRARFFLAYATAPVVISPHSSGTPRWIVKDPLSTFPGEDVFEDYTPHDCIFVTEHTTEGVSELFGADTIKAASKPARWDYTDERANADLRWEVLEYHSADQLSLLLVGQEPADAPQSYVPVTYGTSTSGPGPTRSIMLRDEPNAMGVCLAVVPGSMVLDRQLGHFDGILGMFQAQAMLMGINLEAQQRSVWPREWVVARPNESPEIVQVPDPATGTPGEIHGADLTQQTLDPSFSALETMDRLEYAQRMTASLPSEFGGFSQSDNVRTGRRGAQVMGASIDYTLAEAQDIFAESLVAENERAIAIDKAYYGGQRRSYFFATRSHEGSVTYDPLELWETDKHVVYYPIAGTDIQNLPIEGGQRVAMGSLSRRSFMEIDPLIRDADAEHRRIVEEGLETAFMEQVKVLASTPEGPFQPEQLVRLRQKFRAGSDLFEAFEELQKEVQQEQATPTDDPAEQQPGVAVAGQGVEQPGPGGEAVPEVPTSMGRLSDLLSTLASTGTAQRYRS